MTAPQRLRTVARGIMQQQGAQRRSPPKLCAKLIAAKGPNNWARSNCSSVTHLPCHEAAI
jgi:hypothetical protein